MELKLYTEATLANSPRGIVNASSSNDKTCVCSNANFSKSSKYGSSIVEAIDFDIKLTRLCQLQYESGSGRDNQIGIVRRLCKSMQIADKMIGVQSWKNVSLKPGNPIFLLENKRKSAKPGSSL